MGTQKQFLGGAVAQALASGLTNSGLSFTTSDSTGMPSGGTHPFVIVLERGTANEEKVLVDSRSGNTYTVNASGRGYDGTAGIAHNSGSPVEHCLDAVSMSELSAHENDTTLDEHTQYLNTTRHDVSARHTFGGAFALPSTPASVGTTAAQGTSSAPAHGDHVHVIGAGAINDAGMFAAGILGSAGFADGSVTTAKLAANAVTAAKMTNNTVTATQLANNTITGAQLAVAIGLGRAGYAERTTTQTGIGSSPTDITSLSVTFTAVTTRFYKFTAAADISQVTSPGTAFVNVTDSSNVEQRKVIAFTTLGAASETCAATSFQLTGLSGSVTYKMRASTTAGTLTINTASLMVEDVGGT